MSRFQTKLRLKFLVTAIQHWYLARILLAAFDPNIPQMGPNQKREAARRDVQNAQALNSTLANFHSSSKLKIMFFGCVVLHIQIKQHRV
jgi:hypothetical protein